ncbi:NAD(P)/FAD-dependent oxidoreductase [Bacillus manliponensis]|uniref:NAD(P)/FAD-dependent oxidoreductase n=1 Tax=Bacillus manliponensis TaxID=574376 RepID=UPI0035179796
MKHIVILGGGFAGINLLHGLKKELGDSLGKEVKVTLVDKNSFHFRKVVLFKAITEDVNLKVPFNRYCIDGIECIKGEVVACNYSENEVMLRTEDEQEKIIHYDYLVFALGSVVQEVPSTLGGITLSGLRSALEIKEKLISLIHVARTIESSEMRRGLLRIAVVGGGITGIETAAEICVWLKKEAKGAGLNQEEVEVMLFDSKEYLLHDAPVKVSERLANELKKLGVTVLSHQRVERFENNEVVCTSGVAYKAGECIWTPGVRANPVLKTLQLPLSNEHQILVADSYEVKGHSCIYAIGDGARIIDPKTNKVDGMTCKEAIPQAMRLSKILKNEIDEVSHLITHKAFPLKLYCIALGPANGFVWVQKWGLDFMLSGKIGAYIRERTWDQASLLV